MGSGGNYADQQTHKGEHDYTNEALASLTSLSEK